MFCQIDSIMKYEMHGLSLKLTGYSLRLHLHFKMFRALLQAMVPYTLRFLCLHSLNYYLSFA